MAEIVQNMIRELPVLLGLSVLEGSDSLSWLEFFAIGLIYTGVVFRDERNKKGPHILSKENSRPLSVIVGAHLSYLTIFFALVEITISNGSRLPAWVATARHRDSAVVLGLFLMAEVLSFIERGWLYRGTLADDESVQKSETQVDHS